MTQVKILPEILSNQIAAGEVVERPASVVKELLENSIDANASSITVEIKRGGKTLIRVSDNGIGLSRDDALLSIERYATSKIATTQDLFRISTMGFRGEALPSIASVSKFTMVTRTQNDPSATRIDISGGKIVNVSDAGAPVGTMVEVKNLFFNTPARKKFLKTDNTEISHISDLVTGAALGNPHIRFRLISNNRLQKSFSGTDDSFQRSVSVLGNQTASKLVKIQYRDDDIKISGFAAHPTITRSSSARIYLFVNNRLIYDRGLVSAIFQGYRGRIMKGRFPLAVLFIRIGFDQVDVNVHPAKREIRFFNHQQVYQAVSRAIEQGMITAQEDVTSYSRVQPQTLVNAEKKIESDEIAFQTKPFEAPLKVEQSVIHWTDTNSEKTVLDKEPVEVALHREVEPQREELPALDEPLGLDEPPGIDEPSGLDEPRVIGQVMGTYIVAESRSGMLLIDQHAAHERIVFEALKKRHQKMGIVSQDLVVPETIELTHKESNALMEMIDDLADLGLCIEPFGDTTYIIKSIPDLISDKQIQSLIIDIIEKMAVDKVSWSKDIWLDECLILMACHNAIRANLPMHRVQMEKLLQDLEKCENPMHCPHGRPIVITMTKVEMEKLFKRVV